MQIALSKYSDKHIFWSFAALSVLFFALAIAMYDPLPALVPLGLAGALLVIANPKSLFYLFFFLLPFSVEVDLPNGLATDLPSEPLMLALLALGIVMYVQKFGKVDKSFFNHPITLILILHIFWIAFTAIYSTNQMFSIKFLLAKSWYVIPFYFLPFILFKSFADFRKVFLFLAFGLFIAVGYVMLNHSAVGFSFDGINKAVRPIFRNHVNYGIMLVSFLPFMWFLFKSSKSALITKYLGLAVLVLAIYLTYTRAAQLTVVLSIGVFWAVKWRLTKHAVLISLVGMALLVIFLSVNNRYLDMAPDYNKAIVHDKFDNLLEATYKMQDISTVERFYRWIAGIYMVKEKPLTGFGPATFFSEYKAHTVTSYKTYVSNNPEKSGVHNYYLMTAVEQGIPGFIILLLLAILPLFYGEMAYHATRDVSEKALIMAAIICYAVIDIVIMINDLLEADKVGPFYFFSASIIVYYSVKTLKTPQPTEP